MSFKLEPSAQMQREVRRVACERLDLAITRLDGFEAMGPAEIEASVHAIRKRCKETRALARLVRHPLGADWARFNGLVRDASYELSPIRDVHAVLATLDHLLSANASQDDPDLQTVRSTLARTAAEATMAIQGQDHRITKAAELLTAARREVSGWDIENGSEWLATGFSNTYDRGRRGLHQARKRPTDDRLHEWRKGVKTLWYQVRLAEAAAPSVLTPLIAQLDDLAAALGDDHDLSVLVAKLEAEPQDFGGRTPVNVAVRLARSQQGDLRRRSFRLGATVYAETTGAFAARIERYWKLTIRSGPELATGGIADLAGLYS